MARLLQGRNGTLRILKAIASFAALTMLLAACSSDESTEEFAGSGTTSEVRYANAFGTYHGLVYVPALVGRDQPAPLVVVLHGANTTAEQMQAFSRFNPLARREGFIVLYPDHETDSQVGLHPLQSWHFPDPLEQQRGFGDAEAIAELTQQVMQAWKVDPQRVYIVGVSAGGWMTSIMGAAYPDLYAAIGVVEGGGYGIGLAGFAQPVGAQVVRPEVTALMAYNAMGSHARVVPVINFQGDQDVAVPPETGAHAVQQWLMTNNLVESGGFYAPFPLTPTETVGVTPAIGYPFEVDIYRDAEGCRVLEQVRVEGLAHFWPGGSDDSRYAGFTDPLAPNAAEMSWAFLKRFRLSDTASPCVESGRP